MERPPIGSLSLAVTAVALLVAGSASCALRLAGSNAANHQAEIRLLETRLREAALARATDVLDYLLADEYTNINAYGQVRDKAKVIEDIKSGDISFEAIDLNDISVRLYGDAAVLTAKRTVRGTAKGRDPSGEFRAIRVFAIREGRWEAVMLQITRIAE